MKFLILFFISFSTWANFVPKNQIESGNVKNIYISGACPGECVRVPPGYNPAYHVIGDVMVPDIENPIWGTRSMVEPCSGETDCKEKALAKECAADRQAYYNQEYSETWCNKITGYAQKPSGAKEIVIDEAKKSAYETAMAQKKAEQNAINSRLSDMQFGQKLYAIVQVLNKQKGLSKAQRNQMRNELKTIRDDLLDGNICEVREQVLQLTIDGTKITNNDVSAILAKIDEYKTCN